MDMDQVIAQVAFKGTGKARWSNKHACPVNVCICAELRETQTSDCGIDTKDFNPFTPITCKHPVVLTKALASCCLKLKIIDDLSWQVVVDISGSADSVDRKKTRFQTVARSRQMSVYIPGWAQPFPGLIRPSWPERKATANPSEQGWVRWRFPCIEHTSLNTIKLWRAQRTSDGCLDACSLPPCEVRRELGA
jgi:hypothetical protein